MTRRVGRADVLLFFGLWLVYGICINSSNLTEFNLQQAGVEAIVERGHFYVDGSETPQLRAVGDIFQHGGHLYAAKQPGQFLAGAAVYYFLHLIGLSYYKNYLLTAAAVTFFTAALATAAAAVCVFRLAKEWSAPDASRLWPYLVALSFGIGSTAFPYAGVAHHDALASAYLVIALYLLLPLPLGSVDKLATAVPPGSPGNEFPGSVDPSGLKPTANTAIGVPFRGLCGDSAGEFIPRRRCGADAAMQFPRKSTVPLEEGRGEGSLMPAFQATLAGLLLGATLTTSMLPFFMALVVAACFRSKRQRRLVPAFVAGVAAGLAPLFLYNAVSFGNPFLVPNVAGQFADTFFYLDWRNFTSKVRFYTTHVSLYVPVFWCGLGGLVLLPRQLRRERCVLGTLVLVLIGYVSNIETIGGCQYGPRYLLPAMPYAALGLIGWTHLQHRSARRTAAIIIIVVATYSTAVNVLGALYGVMYCDLRHFGFLHYLEAIRHDKFWTFPLALWLVIPFGVWLVKVAEASSRGHSRRS